MSFKELAAGNPLLELAEEGAKALAWKFYEVTKNESFRFSIPLPGGLHLPISIKISNLEGLFEKMTSETEAQAEGLDLGVLPVSAVGEPTPAPIASAPATIVTST